MYWLNVHKHQKTLANSLILVELVPFYLEQMIWGFVLGFTNPYHRSHVIMLVNLCRDWVIDQFLLGKFAFPLKDGCEIRMPVFVGKISIEKTLFRWFLCFCHMLCHVQLYLPCAMALENSSISVFTVLSLVLTTNVSMSESYCLALWLKCSF